VRARVCSDVTPANYLAASSDASHYLLGEIVRRPCVTIYAQISVAAVATDPQTREKLILEKIAERSAIVRRHEDCAFLIET